MDLAPVAAVAGPATARSELGAVDLHVCRAIRAIRVAQGMSRPQVATHLGVKLPTLQKWEQGEIRVFPSALVELSRLFGVPIAAFFPGGMVPDNPARRRLRQGELRQIAGFVATVRRIPSEQLQEAMVLVTALIREGQAPALAPSQRGGGGQNFRATKLNTIDKHVDARLIFAKCQGCR